MATQPFEAAPPAAGPRNLVEILGDAVRGWDRFWFRPADPTTLGLIRLCVGLVTLYVHLVYTLDLDKILGRHAWLDPQAINELRRDIPVTTPSTAWVPEQPKQLPLPDDPAERAYVLRYQRMWGVDPRVLPARGYPVFSVFYHLTDPRWIAVVHGLTLVVMLLFAVGFCTRVTSALTWVMALSYIQRAPTTLFGMDTMMIIALLYLMIGPSGAAVSVDRLLERWWRRRQAAREHRPEPAWLPPAPMVTANLAIRLFQVHFCMIYLASGLSKLQGAAWWNGTALWLTLANYEFSPFNWAPYVDFLVFLCNHRVLWELVTSGGVVFTLVVEIGLPFLIWRRQTRWLMIIASVLLHTGISLSMGLTTFGLMMMGMLLSFVPPAAVRQLLDRIPVVGRHGAEQPAAALAA
jgi:hypothetical protein